MADLVLKLAESVKSTAGVRTAYGEPVTLDGVTVIPVALAWFGFGAGEAPDDTRLGGGGGGGGASIPIGVHIRDESGVRFEPNPIALLAVAIPFVWVTTRGLGLIFKSLRRRRRWL
ncbi:GerW family sporulation protein [Rathayibacter sp. KR2-224]|uniref:GerW family sporulation protein n=1 Tax=Rathayibacter sp. KR2-224 TaxID=3400913 RepID=UPI003BFBF5C0